VGRFLNLSRRLIGKWRYLAPHPDTSPGGEGKERDFRNTMDRNSSAGGESPHRRNPESGPCKKNPMRNRLQRITRKGFKTTRHIKSPRFIPYIQLHEFEALLLSDPQKLDWQARLWPRRSALSLFGISVPISTSGSGRSKNLDKTQVSDLAL